MNNESRIFGMKKMLFLCVENACRSQMAAAFFKKLAPEFLVDSAGSAPADKVDPFAVEVMREKGLDISQNKPKKFTPEMGAGFDYVVTMGCGDACPITGRKKAIEWDIENPRGKTLETYRQVRDLIEKKTIGLAAKLKT